MDAIRLGVEIVGPHDWAVGVIHINERLLVERVREVEIPFAAREGHPTLAGDYLGLPIDDLYLPSRHLLGEPAPGYDYEGKVPVLGCRCGVVDCWPLLVRITVDDMKITWSDFEQPFRRAGSKASHWRYDGLGPFMFDRKQYEAAIAGLTPGVDH